MLAAICAVNSAECRSSAATSLLRQIPRQTTEQAVESAFLNAVFRVWMRTFRLAAVTWPIACREFV